MHTECVYHVIHNNFRTFRVYWWSTNKNITNNGNTLHVPIFWSGRKKLTSQTWLQKIHSRYRYFRTPSIYSQLDIHLFRMDRYTYIFILIPIYFERTPTCGVAWFATQCTVDFSDKSRFFSGMHDCRMRIKRRRGERRNVDFSVAKDLHQTVGV